jgi:hypothetical protein
MKHLKIILLMGCFVCLSASVMTSKAKAGELNQKTIFTFEKPVQLPGIVLPAGTYIFKLVNFTIDRNVVQVLNQEETKIYATIMTVPSYRQNPVEDTLIVFEERSGGSPQAIKEWFFPDRRYGHEFIYPKKESIELAKAEPVAWTDQSGQAMQDEESDYSRLLQMEQTEPSELAKAEEEPGTSNRPSTDAELDYMQLLQQEQKRASEQEQAPIPVQSAMLGELPRTASHLPLVFVSGILLVIVGFGVRFNSSK